MQSKSRHSNNENSVVNNTEGLIQSLNPSSPSNSTKRRQYHRVSNTVKDSSYVQQRKKNREAVKKCRENAKFKETRDLKRIEAYKKLQNIYDAEKIRIDNATQQLQGLLKEQLRSGTTLQSINTLISRETAECERFKRQLVKLQTHYSSYDIEFPDEKDDS